MTDSAELFSLSSEVEEEEPLGRYDRSIVDEVWESSDKMEGNDEALWRRDEYGSPICRSEYGNRKSSFGWEIFEVAPGNFQVGAGGLKALHIDNI